MTELERKKRVHDAAVEEHDEARKFHKRIANKIDKELKAEFNSEDDYAARVISDPHGTARNRRVASLTWERNLQRAAQWMHEVAMQAHCAEMEGANKDSEAARRVSAETNRVR